MISISDELFVLLCRNVRVAGYDMDDDGNPIYTISDPGCGCCSDSKPISKEHYNTIMEARQ